MKYKLKVYSIWEFGQRKDAEGNPHQEDNLYPAFGKETEDDRTFILCDGMGGHDAGEVASATVCEAMSASVLNRCRDAEGEFTDEDLQAAVAAAFDALDSKDNGAEKKMGTTMTFLKLHNEGVTIAHIGDSRVYHIRPGKTGEETQILHETEDHSLVNDLVKIGELTREEARFSKQKNVITRAMQPKQERRPKADVYHTADIKPGDYFYMCSDGMLEQPEMENGQVLKNIFSAQGGTDERRIEILKGATEENRDNHTAFIIHVTEVTDPIAVPEQPVVPTKHVGIVEEEDEALQNAAKPNTVRERPAKDGSERTPKGRNSFLSGRNIAIGVAIIALGVFGATHIKSCISEPVKEQQEQPARRPARPEKPVRPAKQEPQPDVLSNPTPTQQSVPQPQAATDNGTTPTPASQPGNNVQQAVTVSLPASGDADDVVSSDANVVMDAVNNAIPGNGR